MDPRWVAGSHPAVPTGRPTRLVNAQPTIDTSPHPLGYKRSKWEYGGPSRQGVYNLFPKIVRDEIRTRDSVGDQISSLTP